MSAPRVSVILITHDEERNLGRALRSVEWADEVVVVDSGSTDRTEEIAREHGARFLHRDWEGFGAQKQRALEQATGDWVLSLDADEEVGPGLRDSILEAARAPGDRVGFEVRMVTRFAGGWLWHRGWRRETHLRLFRRDRGRFPPRSLHEGVEVDGPVGRLDGYLFHYSWTDIAHQVDKMNRYTSLSAGERHERGKRAGALTPFLRGVAWFLKDYLARGGFLHGRAGLVHAGLFGIYSFVRFAKLWEMDRDEDPPRPEEPGRPGSGPGGPDRAGSRPQEPGRPVPPPGGPTGAEDG